MINLNLVLTEWSLAGTIKQGKDQPIIRRRGPSHPSLVWSSNGLSEYIRILVVTRERQLNLVSRALFLGIPPGNEVKLQLKIICWYNCLSVLCHLKVFKQIRGKKTDNIRITYLPILLGNNKSYVTVRIPSMKNSSTLVKRPSLFKVSGKSKIAAAFFIVFPVPSFSMVAT